jgi:hypothetical protein
MSRSRRLAPAPDARRPLPAAVALLVLLAQVAACLPEPGPDETPDETPQAQTSPYSLTASPRDPENGTQPPGSGAVRGVLTTNSALGVLDFRYDAYVITAQESGNVIIQSDVLEANPDGYRYGYAYPLSMVAIEDGISLSAYGGHYIQNALETGTAIMEYPVQKGRQYILVYKTFGKFTPLTYLLWLPSTLTVEGRIYAPPEPVIVPQGTSGNITLENPRPDALNRVVPLLSEKVKGG